MQIHLSLWRCSLAALLTPERAMGLREPSGRRLLLVASAEPFRFSLVATCTIPTEAQAYSFDITVVPPGPLTYVAAYPTGQPTPVAAIAVESPQGTLASDTGIIPAGSNGSIDVYASNPTDLVVDINGYYVSFAFAFPNLNAMESITVGNSKSAIGVNALMNVGNTACGYLGAGVPIPRVSATRPAATSVVRQFTIGECLDPLNFGYNGAHPAHRNAGYEPD